MSATAPNLQRPRPKGTAHGGEALSDLVSWRASFIGAGILLLAAWWLMKAAGRDAHPAKVADFSWRLFDGGAVAAVVWLCFLTSAVAGGTLAGSFPIVGVLAKEVGVSASSGAGAVLGCFAAGGLCYALNVRKVLRWLRRSQVAGVGGVAAMAGLVLMGSGWSVTTLAAGYGLIGLGFAMQFNSILSAMADLIRPERRGLALSLNSLAMYLGAALGPVLYLAGMEVAPTLACLSVAAALLGLSALGLMLGLRRLEHTQGHLSDTY